MALHQKKEVANQILDCVFASKDLSVALPKYKFPEHETVPDVAYQVIHDELLLDGNSRQNLATFCQTWEEPQVHALMDLSMDKNLEDKDEYPQTAEIERRCVHMMADLWQAHDASNTVGTSTIGSSEACMLAGMAAKWRCVFFFFLILFLGGGGGGGGGGVCVFLCFCVFRGGGGVSRSLVLLY